MLKVLLLRKKLDAAKKNLEALRAKDADFEKREGEIAESIEEAANMEGSDEEIAEAQKAVEEATEAFDAEKSAHEEEKAKLESEISELEDAIASEEAAQETKPVEQDAKPEEGRAAVKNVEVRTMKRNKIFEKLSMEERTRLFAQDDVQEYLANVRTCIKEKRAITNAGLLIPEVFIGLLKENIENYSKLYKHVNAMPIGGKGREIVQGTIPEGIWTECCAVLNELTLAFNDVEVDCYKVGGYFKVCNAILEDSDIDLASTLLEAIAQAIGLALDKAILYGRNGANTQKMPLGIVSRLAQTSEPANYPATARAWVDLHSTNIVTLSAGLTGAALFKQIVLASGKAKNKYSRGVKTWVMNETTYTKLMAETVSVDASGRIVTGISDVMPVVGGSIEVLNFVPDNVIIGGYFDLYLLGERAGSNFAESEHAFFIQDQTAFKGTARYDGLPVIAEAFVAIGLEATTPDATMQFAPDTANRVEAILTNASAASVVKTETYQIIASTLPIKGEITYASSDDTKATVDANGLVTGVAAGSATITLTSGDAMATVTMTVTNS